MKSYVFLLVAVLAFLGRSDQSSKHVCLEIRIFLMD